MIACKDEVSIKSLKVEKQMKTKKTQLQYLKYTFEICKISLNRLIITKMFNSD